MIALDNVSVLYGRTVALDALSLALPPGIIGLFGQNGSGKSTLLRVLTGLLRPTSGTVTIDGRPVRSSDESLRARIGYAGHASGLYARLTLIENLELFAGLHDVPPARAQELLANLGLAGRARTAAGELSAGLTRRAAVARALVGDPDLLLLDEPYANLDDDAAGLVTNTIVAWHTPERTCLVATHGAKRVKPYAHAGIILQRGRLVTHGLYRREPVEAT